MAENIGAELRREIRSRSGARCEYCLMPERLLMAGCEADHIISRKHGGPTELGNLAMACTRCNRYKGTDVGSVHPVTGEFVRLFNPRLDRWEDHFRLAGALFQGLTPIGDVTISLLNLTTRSEFWSGNYWANLPNSRSE